MKKNRMLALVLAILMVIMILPQGAFALTKVYDPDSRLPDIPEGYNYYGENYTDENDNIFFYIARPDGIYGLETGYWIDEYGNKLDSSEETVIAMALGEQYEVETTSEALLPERYDGREYGVVTAVESQISGTCWAHATIAALESSAIIQGLADNTLNLNEYHTVWNCTNGYYDKSTDSKNDGYVASSLNGMMANGGTATKAGYALLNFAGAVTESSFPLYSTGTDALIQEMQSKMTVDNKYDREITAAEIISIGTNRDKVKQAIMTYGGMYFSYTSYSKGYTHYSVTGQPITTYYSKGIKDSADGGHAVEVIGWDDNFSVDNFTQGTRPTKPGAWLLKNSWGSGWGMNGGYFWMSYEEPSFYGCYAVKAMSTEEYEDVLMYDGLGTSTSVSCTAAANVFTAEKDEYLTKFSIGKTLYIPYTMTVYRLNDNYKNPEDGEVVYRQKGNLNGQKYIDITGKVEVQKGERFSVVIEGLATCAVEGVSSTLKKYTSNLGESYYYNTKWVDSSAEGKNNVCIRVVAKERKSLSSYTVKYSCPGNYTVRYMSNEGNVQLPQSDGYTWVLTYNGETFDGTNVDRDMTVEAHCYPTAGEVSEDSCCITEYRCIYCGGEQKAADIDHNMKTKLKSVSGKNSGYTYSYCTKCGYETRKNYITMLFSKSGTLNDNIHWQYYAGKLSIDGLGAMPDYYSTSSVPWSKYIDDIKTIYVNRGITYVGSNTFTGKNVEDIQLADTVTKIGNSAFTGLGKLTELNLPDSLTDIGDSAFYSNRNLTDISFGNNVKSIGDYAFDYCTSLKEVTIPGTVTYLGEYMFNNCVNLRKITFAEGIEALDYSLFYSDMAETISLDELVIPSTVSAIGSYFFADVDGINSITVSDNSEYFTVEDGVLFGADKTVLYYYTAGKTNEYYNVPDSVTEIRSYAFSHNRYLKYLDMSCGAQKLQSYTINDCSALTNVNLPPELIRIFAYAIYNVNGINGILIPDTLVYLLPYTWIASSIDGFAYPKLYSQKALTAVSRMTSVNNVKYITNHTDHKYATHLWGAEPDCVTSSERIRGCECGGFEYYTGEHCYHWVTDKPATCGEDGVMHRQCLVCYDIKDAQTVIKASAKHDFREIVNADTLVSEANCTDSAVYCYSCRNCGALDETRTFTFGDPNGHDFSGASKYNHNGTHTTKCANCDTWSAPQYCTWVRTAENPGPNCITGGLDHYVCEYCSGETDVPNGKVGSHQYANGHCIYCNAEDPQASCTCDCHKTGAAAFFWRIKCGFYKLFGTHKVCECGKIHY